MLNVVPTGRSGELFSSPFGIIILILFVLTLIYVWRRGGKD
jgi:uncharacterized membrane protein (DUF485 family)